MPAPMTREESQAREADMERKLEPHKPQRVDSEFQCPLCATASPCRTSLSIMREIAHCRQVRINQKRMGWKR